MTRATARKTLAAAFGALERNRREAERIVRSTNDWLRRQPTRPRWGAAPRTVRAAIGDAARAREAKA